ncbi:unnamed protein product [Rotaria magnacalcarata]|uniref:DDE Tnp4 domain-containing protein n=1 Tax=Rotaria magnacalcarata TaxID=392030 RepID=A0A816MUZ2_9BILA|nr:unnamed protein product [Rotaria magnacalcarata]CAF2117769.1 unnamed protein product [Rotaria magnacalcarata]
MEPVAADAKICGSCRGAYYDWKKRNPDFDGILSRIDGEMSYDDGDNCDTDTSANDSSSALYGEDSRNDTNVDDSGNDTNVDDSLNEPNEPYCDSVTHGENGFITLSMNCTISSHRKCCVCQQYIVRNSLTVPSNDRSLIWLMKNVFIPEGARCCTEHILNGQLNVDAINQIKPSIVQVMKFSASEVQLLIDQWQIHFQQQKRFNFDDTRSVSDDECKVLTSLMKVQFEDLVWQISKSGIRNSSNRSIRTAVAVLLCKLRFGMSNTLLTVFFQLPDKRTVSRCIESARTALINEFVPKNLGFAHIGRNDIIHQHTSTLAQYLLCENEPNTAIVVIDSAYIYIQKSRNNEFQRKSFNLHKKRSLLKPMLIVSTTGYIIACIGPFLSNYSNNDASIMQNILHRNTDGIRNWLNEGDVIVVDRGFRDCVNAMEDLGLNVVFPPFLNGRKQFTTTAANQSRFVTKPTLANSSLPHLEQYLSIVCSIINRYRPPIKTSSIQDTVIADQMISLRNQKKNFEAFLQKNNLKKTSSTWEMIDHSDILHEFPIMTEDEIINNITLGTL